MQNTGVNHVYSRVNRGGNNNNNAIDIHAPGFPKMELPAVYLRSNPPRPMASPLPRARRPRPRARCKRWSSASLMFCFRSSSCARRSLSASPRRTARGLNLDPLDAALLLAATDAPLARVDATPRVLGTGTDAGAAGASSTALLLLPPPASGADVGGAAGVGAGAGTAVSVLSTAASPAWSSFPTEAAADPPLPTAAPARAARPLPLPRPLGRPVGAI